MKTQIQSPVLSRTQRGFSMMELMVAITLGFIMVAAIGYLYLGSRQSFRTTDGMSRIQENARYALQTIAQNVRMAGYVGCGNLQTMTVTTIANSVTALSPATAITGLDNSAAATTYGGITRPSGDVVSIMGAFGGGVSPTGALPPTAATMPVNANTYGFKKDDVLMVSNCANADIFQVTNTLTGTGPVTLTHATSNNTGNRVGTYGPSDTVLKMERYTYFIGTNLSGGRSLYRTSLREGTVELADNVWDMQIQYGVDANSDGTVDNYATATAVTSWAGVISARISLLMVSQERVLSAAQTYRFFADTAATPTSLTPAASAADRLLLHQVFTTTVGIRNRLL